MGMVVRPFARGLEKMRSLGTGLANKGKKGHLFGTFLPRRFYSAPFNNSRSLE